MSFKSFSNSSDAKKPAAPGAAQKPAMTTKPADDGKPAPAKKA